MQRVDCSSSANTCTDRRIGPGDGVSMWVEGRYVKRKHGVLATAAVAGGRSAARPEWSASQGWFSRRIWPILRRPRWNKIMAEASERGSQPGNGPDVQVLRRTGGEGRACEIDFKLLHVLK